MRAYIDFVDFSGKQNMKDAEFTEGIPYQLSSISFNMFLFIMIVPYSFGVRAKNNPLRTPRTYSKTIVCTNIKVCARLTQSPRNRISWSSSFFNSIFPRFPYIVYTYVYSSFQPPLCRGMYAVGGKNQNELANLLLSDDNNERQVWNRRNGTNMKRQFPFDEITGKNVKEFLRWLKNVHKMWGYALRLSTCAAPPPDKLSLLLLRKVMCILNILLSLHCSTHEHVRKEFLIIKFKIISFHFGTGQRITWEYIDFNSIG